jgi:hypothetical protein
MVLASREKRLARILKEHLGIAYTHALRLLREGKYIVDDDGIVTKVEEQ